MRPEIGGLPTGRFRCACGSSLGLQAEDSNAFWRDFGRCGDSEGREKKLSSSKVDKENERERERDKRDFWFKFE